MPLAKALRTGAFNPTGFSGSNVTTLRNASSGPSGIEPLDYSQYTKKFSPDVQGLYDEQSKVEEEIKSAKTKYAPEKEAAQKRVIELQKNTPESPEFKEIPEFAPTKIDDQTVKGAIGSLMALAMLGGTLSKQSGTAAIKAMTGVIEGWEAGDKERFAKESQIYEKNQRAIVAQNNRLQEQYKNALSKHAGDLQAAMNEIQIIAMKEGDEITAYNAKTGNIAHLIQQINSQDQAQKRNQIEQARLAESIRHARAMETAQQQRLDMMEKKANEKAQTKLSAPVSLKGKQLDNWTNNYATIESIDKILELQEGKIDSSMGLKTYLPSAILNRIFPETVGDRASILDISNIQLKNRSGSAVTSQEFERAGVVFPMKGDDENTIRQKLERLRDFSVRLNNSMLIQPYELPTQGAVSQQQVKKVPVQKAAYNGKTYIKYSDGSIEESK